MRKNKSQPDHADALTRDKIAARAYELFIRRGRVHGHSVEDWLQAERELTGITAAMQAKRKSGLPLGLRLIE